MAIYKTKAKLQGKISFLFLGIVSFLGWDILINLIYYLNFKDTILDNSFLIPIILGISSSLTSIFMYILAKKLSLSVRIFTGILGVLVIMGVFPLQLLYQNFLGSINKNKFFLFF